MKKWLDDLYAILLKRGLPKLDNVLKNSDDILKYGIPKKYNENPYTLSENENLDLFFQDNTLTRLNIIYVYVTDPSIGWYRAYGIIQKNGNFELFTGLDNVSIRIKNTPNFKGVIIENMSNRTVSFDIYIVNL